MKHFSGYLFAMFAVVLLSSFQGEKIWIVSELHTKYMLCDSVVFTLEKTTTADTLSVVIGAEKQYKGKWQRFTDDIYKVSDNIMMGSTGYAFSARYPRIKLSWNPCQSSYFLKKYGKDGLKGQFRFVFFWQRTNSGPHFNKFYSTAFSMQ